MANQHPFVWYNGRSFSCEEGVIPASSRGFRYGDGIFETVRIQRGVPFRWGLHRDRLVRGTKALALQIDVQAIEAAIGEILRLNQVTMGLVRIGIARAGGERGYKPRSRQADLLLETSDVPPLEWRPPSMLRISSFRRPSAAVLPEGCKVAQGLTSTLAGIEAMEGGYDDAVLLTESGFVSEATSSNIFWRTSGCYRTPSLDCGIVAGVMRQVICDECTEGIVEGRFPLDDLLAADEVFLTNIVIGVQSVGAIDVGGRRMIFDRRECAQLLFGAIRYMVEEDS